MTSFRPRAANQRPCFSWSQKKRSKLQVDQVNRAALGSLSQKLATSVSILFSRVAMEIASKAFLGCANRFRLDRGNRSVFLDSDSFIHQTVKKNNVFIASTNIPARHDRVAQGRAPCFLQNVARNERNKTR